MDTGQNLTEQTILDLLEREHHAIDAGIEAYRDGLAHGETRVDELVGALEALRRHIYLEEEFVFPPLMDAGMVPPVMVMFLEHGQLWRAMDVLDGTDLSAGGDHVRALCDDLLESLAGHNAKEEPIIYPQMDVVLGEETKRELREFIATGQMPEGWVCKKA